MSRKRTEKPGRATRSNLVGNSWLRKGLLKLQGILRWEEVSLDTSGWRVLRVCIVILIVE